MEIKKWLNEHLTIIVIGVIMITMVFMFPDQREEAESLCVDKCEELNHEYFYSRTKGIFRNQDCKCKTTNNETIDII